MKNRKITLLAAVLISLTAIFYACKQPVDNTPIPVAVTGVTLDKAALILTVGGTRTIAATIQPAGATNRNVTWASSDNGVATISGGTVTALAVGTATITVTSADGGKEAACAVTVWDGGNTLPIITSIAGLEELLAGLSPNNADDPYTITLNVGFLTGIRDVLRAASGKYASLDLSGSTITTIPSHAFGSSSIGGCHTLIGITIGDRVTSIGDCAFYGCTGLTSIIIPESVTSIEGGAFYDCTGLTGITIPDKVTRIENEVFRGCTSLASVNIPDGVTSIGVFAFRNCTSLTGITIPDSVSNIGRASFYDCAGLTSVNIPNGVTFIGANTFYDCISLAGITIPDSVKSIEGAAFQRCSKLASVKFEGTIPSSGFSSTAFGSIAFGVNIGYIGDLRDKFYATDSDNGTPGIYTRASGGEVWTRQ